MKLELIINNFIHNHENIIILTKSTCVGILTGLTLNVNLDHATMVNALAVIPPTDANLIIEIAKIVAPLVSAAFTQVLLNIRQKRAQKREARNKQKINN